MLNFKMTRDFSKNNTFWFWNTFEGYSKGQSEKIKSLDLFNTYFVMK